MITADQLRSRLGYHLVSVSDCCQCSQACAHGAESHPMCYRHALGYVEMQYIDTDAHHYDRDRDERILERENDPDDHGP